MLNVAMISKWHVHAEGYARELAAMDEVKLTCCWDEDAARGQEWAAELGCDFEPDYDKVLARPDVDAICVCTPTSMHTEIMIKAANAGKHIFTEKVMALTVAECDKIIDAIHANNVKFCISFPQRCEGRNKLIKQLIDDGTLGDVTVLRVRNAHDGSLRNWLPDYWYDPETTGGGAMMDLGAHPMYLARWMMGHPKRIQSMFSKLTGRAVEDNSVCTIEFDNKAIIISETSLVSPMTPKMFEVYGTKGVIICVDDEIKLKTDPQGEWSHPAPLADDPKPLRQFVDAVLHDVPTELNEYAARELTELMESAYIADSTGKEVFFN